jgi:hypothetical protein
MVAVVVPVVLLYPTTTGATKDNAAAAAGELDISVMTPERTTCHRRSCAQGDN